MTPETTIPDRIARTFYLVEATDYETQLLWERHAKEAEKPCEHCGELGERDKFRVTWKNFYRLWTTRVGGLAGKPVMLQVTWLRLEGHIVAMWTCNSMAVDHELIQKFLKETFPDDVRTADAANFGNVINAVRSEPASAIDALATVAWED